MTRNASLAREANLVYDQEYYSSSQACIYFGDIWIDEITGIQYQIEHSKTPIYGYASTLYDAMVRGPLLVRGSFTINFKEAGYLFVVLNEYKKRMGQGNTHPYQRDDKNGTYAIQRANIERLMQKDIDNVDLNKYHQDIAGFVSEAQSRGNPKGLDTAENMFEVFEDVVWGKKGAQDKLNEAGYVGRRVDDHRLNGFDIFVQFGDFSNELANHTMRKIVDVHIVRDSMVIGGDSEPLQESYVFYAKNVI